MSPIDTYEIPLWHPLVVHFPIVLILIGAVAVIVWAVSPRAFWYRAGAFAFVAGTATALLAYLTGEAAEDAGEDVPIVDEIVHLHEDMAIYTLAASLLATVAMILVKPALLVLNDASRDSQEPPPAVGIRWAIAFLALIAAVLVAWTSHLGGIMVWGVPR